MATSGNFFSQIEKKLGRKILNKKIYKEAFTHSSLNLKDSHGKAVNFERLEFLGDAILTAVITEHLYDNYPDANEGSLTILRAKIVSRAKLNQIGEEHQRSILEYCVWYRERPLSWTYPEIITCATANCVVHSNFMSPNVTWSLVEFS